MKKFLALMCSVLVLCLSFAGCSDGWTEVQSITYSVGGETTTYTSKICYYGSYEYVDQDTYESAPNDQKKGALGGSSYAGFPRRRELTTDRASIISECESRIGKTFFVFYGSPRRSFAKETISSYEIEYVRIKKSGDREVQIKHYDDDKEVTISVSTDSYEITYFED